MPLIPLPYILAASVAISGAAGFWAGHHWMESDWNAEKLAQATQRAEAEREARNMEQGRQRAANEVLDDYTAKTQRAQAAAAAARSDADSVRQQLASISRAASNPGATCSAERERIRVLAGLLDEGAGLVEEGAQRVERLDARVTGTQAFVSKVRQVSDAP